MRRNKGILFSTLVTVAAIASATTVFAQAPAVQNRIAQQVVIGGLKVDAAYVLAAGGGIQSYTCPSPQQYTMPDGSSQGWACLDSATNVWLLSALPPQQQAAAPVVVQQPVVQQPTYQPSVVYEVAQPTVIYREPPRVVYVTPAYPRVVERVYSPSAAIEVATINAAGRIAAAVIETSRFHDDRRNVRIIDNRGRRR